MGTSLGSWDTGARGGWDGHLSRLAEPKAQSSSHTADGRQQPRAPLIVPLFSAQLRTQKKPTSVPFHG